MRTATDVKNVARYESGSIGCKKRDGTGDIVRRSKAAEGRAPTRTEIEMFRQVLTG